MNMMCDIDESLREEICKYANTPDNMKETWIRCNPMTTKWMLDYLINVTKDR